MELTMVMRDFCEHALISLNNDYHNYFIYTKGTDSNISKYFDFYDLRQIIEELIYKLFLNGKIKLYFYLNNDKLDLFEKMIDNGNLVLVKTIKWDSSIISESKRKKIIKKLKSLDSSKIQQNYNDKNYSRNFLYINELVRNEILSLTKDFLYSSFDEKNYTDIYHVYSLIRMKKKQLLMVNYVINVFNNSIKEALQINDKNDNIIFNGITMDTLNKLEEQLLSGSETLKKITDCLYSRTNLES